MIETRQLLAALQVLQEALPELLQMAELQTAGLQTGGSRKELVIRYDQFVKDTLVEAGMSWTEVVNGARAPAHGHRSGKGRVITAGIGVPARGR